MTHVTGVQGKNNEYNIVNKVENVFVLPKFGAKISTQFPDINICKWKLLVKFVAILGIDYLKIAHLSNLV